MRTTDVNAADDDPPNENEVEENNEGADFSTDDIAPYSITSPNPT